MSRYESNGKKTYFSIKIILILIALMSITIGLYQWSQRDIGKETKQIAIPIEKPVPDLEEEIALESNENKAINSLVEKQITETEESLKTKQSLPLLDKSDDGLKRSIEEVSPGLANWFSVKDVIRKYIVLINDLSQKQIPFKHRGFIKSPQAIVVKKDKQGLYLAKESYSRFDGFANAIASIDIHQGVRLYLTFRPVFIQIYDEFSYPAAYRVEDIFLKAAASVIDAPSIETRIALVKHTIGYKFADKNLESLNDVEKQMLRMGPVNTKKIQAKLRQLVEAIVELDES